MIVHTSGGIYMPKLATAFYDALFPLPPDHILLNMQIQLMASLQIQIISSFIYQRYILVNGLEFSYISFKEANKCLRCINITSEE